MITAKAPKTKWLESFFERGLLAGSAYQLEKQSKACKLDQNESPFDWPQTVKEAVCQKLLSCQWNRYPEAYAKELEELIAHYSKVTKEHVLLSPGSNVLISLILTYLSPKVEDKIVTLSPSFPLFAEHLIKTGKEIFLWQLRKKDFSFDIDRITISSQKRSLIIFASPNNPTGSSLATKDLETLLCRYPNSYVIADEAYFEFTKESYLELLENYDNLIILRTFSKTLSSAGIRLGYMLASRELCFQLRKSLLPFMLNHFAIIAGSEALKNPEMKKFMTKHISFIKKTRAHIFDKLSAKNLQKYFEVFPSEANFLLLRWPTNEESFKVHEELQKESLLLRNIGKGPGLNGCLRLSFGTEDENRRVVDFFTNYYSK